jgi:AcrR family transcriptional regulator
METLEARTIASFDLDPAACGGQAADAGACAGALKKRGRPKAYDHDTVLEQALEVFWQKGFAATSLDDLVEATGVNRPSLYAGFGDKEALYIKAMEFYQNRLRAQLDGILTCNGQGDTVRAIVNRYFDILIRAYTGEADHPLGCAFMCTALTDAPQHESILDMLQRTIENFDRRFEDFFVAAQTWRCLPADADPKVLTQMISGLTQNLLVRARAGAGRAELSKIASETTAFLFPDT